MEAVISVPNKIFADHMSYLNFSYLSFFSYIRHYVSYCEDMGIDHQAEIDLIYLMINIYHFTISDVGIAHPDTQSRNLVTFLQTIILRRV